MPWLRSTSRKRPALKAPVSRSPKPDRTLSIYWPHDKVDLVFVAGDASPVDAVFQVAGLPLLATGQRPLEELQFTTVLPAIRKLNRLLEACGCRTAGSPG